jgi:NAD(P)-dependent dehydrogenase (short-subunit alcohol dehydrogenase family)
VSETPSWLQGRRAVVAGDGEANDHVADALALHGAEVFILSGASPDGADAEANQLTAEAALGGPADILVHSGSAGGSAPAHGLDLLAWRAAVSSDIDRRFLDSAAFLRQRLKAGGGGAIIFLLPGPGGGVGRSAQATIRGGMENLIKSLAVEWARDGVRINGIASRACEPEGLADPAARTSLGHLAAYLLSDYAAYVSGMVMGVDDLGAG